MSELAGIRAKFITQVSQNSFGGPPITPDAIPCWLVSPILPVAPAFVASRSGGQLPAFRPAPGLRSGRSSWPRELPSIARCSDQDPGGGRIRVFGESPSLE